jgi:hypothetical protein
VLYDSGLFSKDAAYYSFIPSLSIPVHTTYDQIVNGFKNSPEKAYF